MTAKKEEVVEVPVVEAVASEGVTVALAAAPEGSVVLRHPTAFGVYQTVDAGDVDKWSGQGWLRLK